MRTTILYFLIRLVSNSFQWNISGLVRMIALGLSCQIVLECNSPSNLLLAERLLNNIGPLSFIPSCNATTHVLQPVLFWCKIGKWGFRSSHFHPNWPILASLLTDDDGVNCLSANNVYYRIGVGTGNSGYRSYLILKLLTGKSKHIHMRSC
jgi:hypothetical protein